MVPYKLDAVIEEMQINENSAQGLLQALTGKVLRREDAVGVWEQIPDHKWYLSERLGRDVGLRVAAVDLVENLYIPPPRVKFAVLSRAVGSFAQAGRKIVKWYFEKKGGLPA